MPSSVDLICVDPALVSQVWPHVKNLIRWAIRRGDLGLFAPLEHSVLAGLALLWLVHEGNDIKAAIITELQITETRKICVISACGGAEMRQWLHLLPRIEEFGRAEGCDAVRIMGRTGWKRMLKDYRARRVVLEKELA